jgi:hypothetical protein
LRVEGFDPTEVELVIYGGYEDINESLSTEKTNCFRIFFLLHSRVRKQS